MIRVTVAVAGQRDIVLVITARTIREAVALAGGEGRMARVQFPIDPGQFFVGPAPAHLHTCSDPKVVLRAAAVPAGAVS